MSKDTSVRKDYENNPFFVATNGFELLFNKAKSVGIMLAILAAIGVLGSLPARFVDSSEPATAPAGGEFAGAPPVEFWLIIGVVVLIVSAIFLFIGVVLKGISDYTASQIARGKETALSDALRAVFANFWSYTWVLLIVGFKTFLWSLLFIIPGIIMSVRYSLSGVSFFDTKAKGNEAVKRSLALTKGAWYTTFGSQALLNILTLGTIQPILETGTNAVLYRQFSSLKEGEAKPRAHILSTLTVLLPLLLVALLVTIIVLAAANYSQMPVNPETFETI